ncbi:MAG: DUF4124 domain-containing protein [Thermodesulfobacteriota bacterium]
MKRILTLVCFLVLLAMPTFASAELVYKWFDERGVIHLSDDLNQVPEKYRDQVQKMIVPDSFDEPVPQAEKVSVPSLTEPEKPKAKPVQPASGFIPFNKFIHLTEGMSEAEVLSRVGPPTQVTQDEIETQGILTQKGIVKREALVKRYYYIGDPDLGERTTVIHFRNGVVTRIERIFPPAW